MRTEISGPMSVDVEDGGKAKIGTIYSEGDLFVRIQSWDEGCEHTEFAKLDGKKIRVTIEVVEEDPGNEKIYYYLFTINGGKLPFGYHGTEAQWEAKKVLMHPKDTVFLIKKEYCCTVREQEEYSKLSWDEKVALSKKDAENGNSQRLAHDD